MNRRRRAKAKRWRRQVRAARGILAVGPSVARSFLREWHAVRRPFTAAELRARRVRPDPEGMAAVHTFACPVHGMFVVDAPRGCPVLAHCGQCARRRMSEVTPAADPAPLSCTCTPRQWEGAR